MVKLVDLLKENNVLSAQKPMNTNVAPSGQHTPQSQIELASEPAMPRLTKEEKRELIENVANFNAYYESLCSKNMKFKETANKIKRISALAERYVQTEVLTEDNWMEARNAEKHLKELKKMADTMEALSEDCYEKMRQMEMTYDESGRILERYFKIN